MVEELFVALAEVGLIFSCAGSVFGAAAAAVIEVAADEAFVWDALLVACEGSFQFALGEFGQRGFEDVSELPLGFDEEFAAVCVAGVFYDYEACALFAEGTHRVVAEDVICGQGVELADVHFFRAVIVPQVEDATEEVAVLSGGYWEVCGFVCGVVGFYAGYELGVAYVVLYEEVEDFVGVFDVGVVEYDKGVEFDLVLFAVFDASHDFVECAPAWMIATVEVVELFGSVDA